MRCQTELGGAHSAGSGRTKRLDPFTLPARFAAADEAADGHTRMVELDRDQVVLKRMLRGMRMSLQLPVSAYRGVALRAERSEPNAHRISVTLEHRDPALSIPLYDTTDTEDVIAEWQLWGRVLDLPLIVVDVNGDMREPFPRIGSVRLEQSAPRRRRSTAIRNRRPRIVLRRRPPMSTVTYVHQGEREIIARN